MKPATPVHFLADSDDVATLDQILKYGGIKSRSDFLRSCIAVAVHGPRFASASGQDLDPVTKEWVSSVCERCTKLGREGEPAFYRVVEELHLLPSLAAKGVKTVFKATKKDILERLAEEGYYFTEDEIYRLLCAYAAYKSREIAEYQMNVIIGGGKKP